MFKCLNKEKLGQKLKILREDKEYTLTFIASQLGRDSKTIQKWEQGQTIPGFQDLIILKQLYNLQDVTEFDTSQDKDYIDYNKEVIYKIIFFSLSIWAGYLIKSYFG